MSILFFNPSRSGQGNVSLNLPLLMAVARAAGHEVRLYDLDESRLAAERQAFYSPSGLPTTGPAALKTSDYAADFRRFLESYRPQVVAFSSMTIDYDFACEFLAPFKAEFAFTVVAGGIHAILLPEEAFAQPVVDYLLRG